jgi:hypothetical protein
LEGEHRTLGLAGGAGGVQDDRDVVVAAFHRRILPGQVGDQLGQRGIVDQPAVGAYFAGAGGGFVGESGGREQRLGAAVGQVVGHLTKLQQRVHRDRYGAAIHDAVKHDGECGGVGQHHSHPIARLHPGLL